MLSIRSLGKRYPGGTVGLSDFSLEAGEGVLGLLGPNGAGKTTLMPILATVTKPTAGDRFLGRRGRGRASPTAAPAPRLPAAGLRRLRPNLTAREFLALPRRGSRAVRAEPRTRRRAARARRTSRRGEPRRSAGYSGGMRQRVGIAQALARRSASSSSSTSRPRASTPRSASASATCSPSSRQSASSSSRRTSSPTSRRSPPRSPSIRRGTARRPGDAGGASRATPPAASSRSSRRAPCPRRSRRVHVVQPRRRADGVHVRYVCERSAAPRRARQSSRRSRTPTC